MVNGSIPRSEGDTNIIGWTRLTQRRSSSWLLCVPPLSSIVTRILIAIHSQPGRDSPAVINHENPRGYNTSDIWVEHLTKKGWYRHDNRIGDVTVLNNGEKTDNKQLGEHISHRIRGSSQLNPFQKPYFS
jgi:hypothetical protein